jgi:hypothetical protein
MAEKASEHSGHNMMEHQGSMAKMPNQSIMLGEQTVEGVKGKANLKDVGAMMAKMGQKENYHFMIIFSDAKTGTAIEQGTVAVKVIDPKTGQAGEAIALMGMGAGASSHFGADITLPSKGDYQFQVGTKLADGTKRQFAFRYTVQ